MYYAITTSLLLLLIPATSFLLNPSHPPSHTLRSTKSLDFEAIHESVDSLPSPPPLDPTYDVFCNRELNMNSLAAIGFDMDYTLAQYHVPEFDNLAFDGAKQKVWRTTSNPTNNKPFLYYHHDSNTTPPPLTTARRHGIP